MCGILGGINIDRKAFENAKQLLHHRGPDETGEFSFENLYLFHTRLSIQDIAAGQQPFHYNGHTIIFNGEIYNHHELRKRYNLSCRTNSDVETLIVLYTKFGKETFHLLDGMFAFAIFNQYTKRLILVRDRAGEKPIYFYRKGDHFIFGSELNALKSVAVPEINYENFNQYLRYSFIGSNTPYKDIFELPAGSWYEIDIHTLSIQDRRWWQIEDFYTTRLELPFKDLLEKLDEMLHTSVYNRLKTSDLEVGTFLSGGIDSGLVTSIASKYKSNLKTFTVAFPGQYDESSLAELVAKKYNTLHTRIEISFSDLENRLEEILVNYGEPFADSSAIPSYYVSKEAKKHLTVILNGDGADELFGGYRRYVPFSHFDFFNNSKIIKGLSGFFHKLLPYPANKKEKYNYFYRLIDLSAKDPLDTYLSATVDTFEGYLEYFNTDNHSFAEIENMLEILSLKGFSGLQKIMSLDFNFILANDLLVKMDIATMAHALEGRTPFFSNEILEFAPAIKDKFKINGTTTKFILRELAGKYLPGILINQPKRGFEVPLRSWMETNLREITYDYLSGDTFCENFIQKSFIRSLLINKIKVAPEKRAKMLWRLLALEVWYKKSYLT